MVGRGSFPSVRSDSALSRAAPARRVTPLTSRMGCVQDHERAQPLWLGSGAIEQPMARDGKLSQCRTQFARRRSTRRCEHFAEGLWRTGDGRTFVVKQDDRPLDEFRGSAGVGGSSR
jgi:hypothetical protein